jgi:hypothetical protein
LFSVILRSDKLEIINVEELFFSVTAWLDLLPPWLNFSSTQGQRFNWLPQNFTNQQNTWNHSQSPVCVPQSGNLSDQLNCSSTYNQSQRCNFIPQNFTNQQSYNTQVLFLFNSQILCFYRSFLHFYRNSFVFSYTKVWQIRNY